MALWIWRSLRFRLSQNSRLVSAVRKGQRDPENEATGIVATPRLFKATNRRIATLTGLTN